MSNLCTRCARLEADLAVIREELSAYKFADRKALKEHENANAFWKLKQRWKLTPGEAAMTIKLAEADGAVVRRTALWYAVPSMARNPGADMDPKIIDVFIHKIRRKMGDRDCIQTQWGYGFAMLPETAALVREVLATEIPRAFRGAAS